MSTFRARAKDQFPTVMLTLLGIIQALALELIWAHLTEAPSLYTFTFTAVMMWLQIAATLIGIFLIWLIYASNVMRFRFVPTTADSAFPFLIGIVEFTLISFLGMETVSQWLLTMALIFVVMSWVSQSILRRARLDGDNDEYFSQVQPASWRDFYLSIGAVAWLTLAAAYVGLTGDRGWPAMILIASVSVLLSYQTYLTNMFWNRSLN
ncbi:MAG: hypothetical protein O7H39_16335 [Gammaproteobacteria bacterium]|nr:hypothetical protein [Gammaproteobacteria bacterium]